MTEANKDRHAYTLLSGQQLSLGWLGEPELACLEEIKASADAGEDYFELLRVVRGPESLALADFGGKVTQGAAQSIFFQVALDIVERVGIRQGRVLDPADARIESTRKFVGMAEAARLIGKSRQTVHKALQRGAILGWRLGMGNTWIVDLKSALEYKSYRP
jgi:hypothetical protein